MEPADRLLAILTDLQNSTGSYANAWAKVLGTAPTPASISAGIQNVERLTLAVERQIRSLDTIHPEAFLETLGLIRSVSFVSNIQEPFSHQIEPLNRAIYGMKFIVGILAKVPKSEKLLPDEMINKHLRMLRTLISDLSDDRNLTEAIKLRLVDMARRMEAALRDYQRFGIGPSRDMLGQVVAQALTDPVIGAAEKDPQQKPGYDRFMQGLKDYGAIVSAATGTTKLLDYFGPKLINAGKEFIEVAGKIVQ